MKKEVEEVVLKGIVSTGTQIALNHYSNKAAKTIADEVLKGHLNAQKKVLPTVAEALAKTALDKSAIPIAKGLASLGSSIGNMVTSPAFNAGLRQGVITAKDAFEEKVRKGSLMECILTCNAIIELNPSAKLVKNILGVTTISAGLIYTCHKLVVMASLNRIAEKTSLIVMEGILLEIEKQIANGILRKSLGESIRSKIVSGITLAELEAIRDSLKL
jgi:hypothetical protein